jgi:hypothetical protein
MAKVVNKFPSLYKFINIFSQLLLIFYLSLGGVFSFPGLSSAAPVTLFSDGFGTGSTDYTFNETPAWTEGGAEAEKRPSGSGNDSASPDGGRFAVIYGDDVPAIIRLTFLIIGEAIVIRIIQAMTVWLSIRSGATVTEPDGRI